MTVEKNIAFGLKQDKLPVNKINQRVDEMLELVELTDFAKRKPNQLSGGQCQRVALARSLAKQPKLLLLDEPLGALDKRLREQTQFELMNIQEKLGITFIIVTHDQEEAMTVSSRIGVMDTGNVIQVASPNQIYEEPATKDVAEFIGNVNLFEGVYEGFNKTGTKLKCEHSDSFVYSSQQIDIELGAKIWLAVRPEKLEISKSLPSYKHNILKGKVVDIGYGGSFSTYHVQLTNGNMLSAVRANRERTFERSITWDDEVYLHWSTKSAIVLTG
jgi:putrescine transport system ATP-binding protein